MKNEKLVSIITPSYKSVEYISSTIDSVINQTYQNWEMIIVDDCSPDNTNDIIEVYIKKDSRVRLVRLDENVGPANARNRGIEEAKGKYISFLDSDDIWLPEKLKKQIGFMCKNNLLLTYSSYFTIDEFNKNINTRISNNSINYNDMLKSNRIGNLTGIYDCEKLGKFYMDDVGHEDYTLWLKIMKKIGQTQGLIEPLAKYRILSNSISANKLKVLKWQWHIYRNIINLNIFKSSYYFIWYIYYALKKRR